MDSVRPTAAPAAQDEADESGERPIPTLPPAVEEALAEDEPASGRAPKGSTIPEMAALEPALGRGDWRAVANALGGLPPGELPPAQALIRAVAMGELLEDDSATELNLDAIRSVAQLFEVEEDSRIAVLLAKRVMRQNPVRWHHRGAPRPAARVALLLLVVALGAIVGWLLGPGIVRLEEVLAPMF